MSEGKRSDAEAGRLAELQKVAAQIEKRADAQPGWMKGTIVFAEPPATPSVSLDTREDRDSKRT